jgi:hypothetical protein
LRGTSIAVSILDTIFFDFLVGVFTWLSFIGLLTKIFIALDGISSFWSGEIVPVAYELRQPPN